MPHPWFQMLQDEEAPAAEAPAAEAPAPAAGAGGAAGGDVVFPDDYPNSVKHFLMLGAVGMLIGAVVFLSLNMLRSKRSTVHSVTFILATVMAMSYYAMWTGLGVTFKTTDTSPRVIFWGRYLGHLIAMPLVLVDLLRVQAGRGRYADAGVLRHYHVRRRVCGRILCGRS